jgi:transposase
MGTFYVIAMDVHSYNTQSVVYTPSGRKRCEQSLPTTIPALRQLVRDTPRPRHVVFEEGPLAGWLYRHLQLDADAVVVAETRRNAYVAKDGDKSDPIDAAKLGQLYRGGLIRPVHHTDDAKRASFKELVLFYHRRVSWRVAAANRVIWAVRGHGVVIKETIFEAATDRQALWEPLPRDRMLQLRLEMLLIDYDLAVEHEQETKRELLRRAGQIRMIREFGRLPGIGPIRAATFYALIDTPFRFRSKSALWKYMGIGLERRSSGAGREQVKLPRAYNRQLKSIILGAARSVAHKVDGNPFTRQYRRCIQRGQSPQRTRRTVARSLAAVMWGMFKSNTTYRPDWVGVPSGRLQSTVTTGYR